MSFAIRFAFSLATLVGAAQIAVAETGWDRQMRDALSGLGIIAGAFYDAPNETIILVGDGNNLEASPSPEQVAVAFRWAFAEEPGDPYVSIDPIPEDPEGPYMQIRIDELSRDTYFGWILFEADRLLKGYSLGKDSISHIPVDLQVPGYQSIFGWSDRFPGRQSGTPVWSRFWFRPSSADAQWDETALRIVECRVGVETEIMFLRNGKLESSGGKQDPAADAFAEHFTENYRTYAAEEPVFLELEQQTRLMIVSDWIRELRERSLPVNLAWITGRSAPEFRMPAYTPSLRVSRTRKTQTASSIITETAQLFGGVDLAVRPRRLQPTDSFRRWKEALKPSLPKDMGKSATLMAGGETMVAAALPGKSALPSRPKSDRLLGARLSSGEIKDLTLRPAETNRNLLADGSGRELAVPTLLSYRPNGRRTAQGKTGFSEFTSVEGKPGTKLEVREYELTSPEGKRMGWFSEHEVNQATAAMFVKPRSAVEHGWLLAPDSANNNVIWAIKDGQRRWAFSIPGGEVVAEWRGQTLLRYRYNRSNTIERIETVDGELLYAFEHSHGGTRIAGMRTGDGQAVDLRGVQRSEIRSLPEEIPLTVSLYGNEHSVVFRPHSQNKWQFLNEAPSHGEVAKLLQANEHKLTKYYSSLEGDIRNIHITGDGSHTMVFEGNKLAIVEDRVTAVKKAARKPDRLGSRWKSAVESLLNSIGEAPAIVTGDQFALTTDFSRVLASQIGKGTRTKEVVAAENYTEAGRKIRSQQADLRDWSRGDVQRIVFSETIGEQSAAPIVLRDYYGNRELDVTAASPSSQAGVVFLLYHATPNINQLLLSKTDLFRGKTVVCVGCKPAGIAGPANLAKELKDAGAQSVINADRFLHSGAAKRIMDAADAVSSKGGPKRNVNQYINEVMEEAAKHVEPGTPQSEEIESSIRMMMEAAKKPTASLEMRASSIG